MPTQAVTRPESSEQTTWYKDAAMYEMHVKAFFDSNNDGIGDFQGLRQKLDYLQDLGIDCIWLLLFYQSPGHDDGYDVSDYCAIQPQYGTIEDFKEFLDEAHRRNIWVLVDLVINHTSDQHPWFQAARRSKDPAAHDFYVWSDTYERYHEARVIFTDTELSNWTWDDEAQQFYWHRFFSHQPDLNFESPAVRQAILEVVCYWLEIGVDGFRVDAVPYLFEREGTNSENLAETHTYLKDVRRFIDTNYPGRILLAEANQLPADLLPYFGEGDEFHRAFNFPLMPRVFMAVRQEDRQPIIETISQLPTIPPNCQWGIFLRNHDELTLEMVTEEEREYLYNEYVTDPRQRLNIGIRCRMTPLLDNSRRRLELVNSLLLTLPGTPIIYYGDEIGMGDNITLGDRMGVRTPMQWDISANAGFSGASEDQLYSPVITDPVYNYQAVNVEGQLQIQSSFLQWMKRSLQLRKQHAAFSRGEIEFLDPENAKVLAYIRSYGDEKLLVVNNLSRFSQPVELHLARHDGCIPRQIAGRFFPGKRSNSTWPGTTAAYPSSCLARRLSLGSANYPTC